MSNLGHDDNLLSRQVQLLNGIAKDDFRKTVGVRLRLEVRTLSEKPYDRMAHIRSIESLDAVLISEVSSD